MNKDLLVSMLWLLIVLMIVLELVALMAAAYVI